MGTPLAVRQYRVPCFVAVRVRQIESLAGRWVMLLTPVDDALVLHDLPECIATRVRRQIRRFLPGSMQSVLAGSRQGEADGDGGRENSA
jgi:hypothetical protein